jgi:hypothetical protein
MSFACATPSKSPKRSIVSIFYAVVPQLGVWLCAEYQYLQIKLPKLSEITKASLSAQAFDEMKPMIFEFEINKNKQSKPVQLIFLAVLQGLAVSVRS